MNSNSKVYVVMAGYCGEEGFGHPNVVFTSKAAAEATATLMEMPDGDEQDTYAYVVEVDFYD